MKPAERTRRLCAATLSMVLGTVVVFGTVILINRSMTGPENRLDKGDSQVQFQRKKPEEKQKIQRPKPKPKPRRSRTRPPAPTTGLSSALSGVDMGLPGFSADDLGALDVDLLGDAGSMVMTDDTVDQPPRATFQAPVEFPPRARARGMEGYVVFSLLIGLTGEIEEVEIVESYPEGVFDEAALQGINQWRFEPAIYQGQAVRAWARQRIRFDLS